MVRVVEKVLLKNYEDIDVKRKYYNSEEAMLKRLADLEKRHY